ncbi:hypothetical protein [Corynebacterium sp. A21]|uniref:hypothetical protein n=1 Tax=Corynebacterium sp. A21 TaxID=3457318 RepID=UPI003FD379F2
MYGWFWRTLPGPWPLKTLIVVVVLIALFFLLMEVIFPALSLLMPYADVAV